MPGRGRLVVVLPLLLALAAACSGQPGGSEASPTGATATPGTATPPGSSTSPPVATASEPGPSTPPATPTGSASTAPPDASACTGSAVNQAFFAEAARQLKWDVYCAVLPVAWYLTSAQFRGDQLTASYKGPGNVHLQLQEGAYCADDPSICEPRGDAVGPTLYGDKSGTLYALSPGYAVYVNPGPNPPSWAAASVDLDESTFVKLVAQLHHVVP